MPTKYRISLVSYLNTKPFLYGLQHAEEARQFALELDIPSVGGQKILDNAVDIGLVPVAVLSKLQDARIISDYCIGADGDVKSVCLFSHVPIEEIKEVYLDYHSMTSVQLVQILFREYWKRTPQYLEAKTGYIDAIQGTTAGLIIGDRALAMFDAFPYVYDLSAAWKSLTGLPFVFAAWITRKDIPQEVIDGLNKALAFGLDHIDTVVEMYAGQQFDKETVRTYFTHNIDYQLDGTKRKALETFIGKIHRETPSVV
ncbi:MAG TPA: menaquinone biosynthesis protein [Chitinophagales bacterium]|jgi:chorismate dehydratase|nr:menaquinone biosynthesis protein [Chitinophagales bacterium]